MYPLEKTDKFESSKKTTEKAKPASSETTETVVNYKIQRILDIERISMLIVILIMTLGFLCRGDDGGAPQPLALTTSMTSPLSKEDQTGFYDQILIEAFRRVKQPVKITHLPTERSITNANLGISDGEFPRISGLDRLYPNLIKVPEKIVDFEFVAFTWRDDIKLKDWSSCKPYNVAIVRGWKILETNLADVKSLVKVKNQQLLFALLAKHRIDIVVYSRLEGYEMIKKLDLKSVKVIEPPLAKRAMFLYLNKKHQQLIPEIEKQLKSIKDDGTYDRILKKTLAPYLEGASK
jgi:polar amino acid transport system substrate-binding protein